MTDCGDPAFPIITQVIEIVRQIFSAEGAGCPPVSGRGGTKVRFVTGEGPVWDPLVGRYGVADETACEDPFIWVRLMSRYRTGAFPDPGLIVPCGGVATIALEIGVGRCIYIAEDGNADYDVIALEAEWGADDSYRLDRVVCLLSGLPDIQVAAEPIIPQGPDGGGIVWSVSVFIGITS